MATAGRKPIDPMLRRQKVNLQYTSVETWAYNELINEARASETNLTKQVEAAIAAYAKTLRNRKKRRGAK